LTDVALDADGDVFALTSPTSQAGVVITPNAIATNDRYRWLGELDPSGAHLTYATYMPGLQATTMSGGMAIRRDGTVWIGGTGPALDLYNYEYQPCRTAYPQAKVAVVGIRQVKGPEDLAERLRIAGGIAATRLDSRETAERAALRYDSISLRKAEEKRDAEQKAKTAELRKRFVDRPVLVLPNAGGSFSSSGITPIPGVGTVFPEVRVTAEWGVLQAAQVLRPDDRSNITVPAPASVQGSTLEGDGWTLKIAPGWVVRAGNRPGDFQLVRNAPRQ
jgi:hypothetical protein